jgi:hypothetical protein
MTTVQRRGVASAASVAALLFIGLSAGNPRLLARAGCDLAGYRAAPGLTAASAPSGVALTWDGDGERLRLHLRIDAGTPMIDELAVQARSASSSAPWRVVLSGARPEFRVVTGLRRITNQQLDPLAGLGIPITPEIVEREKWEAFWDAPLNVPGGASAHNNTTPPQRGVLDQPGLPRSPSEVERASAVYRVTTCQVRTDGARLEVSFPGVTLGAFEGRLEYTVYRGTNLIRQEIVGMTHRPAVAYKYDAGVDGVRVGTGAGVAWTNVDHAPVEHAFGPTTDDGPVTVRSADRIIVASLPGGSVAAFPPPHNFFWARETNYNLGYNWYRQTTAGSLALGVRQAESEEPPEVEQRGTEDRHQNFALRSARPGTWQRMPVYLYVTGAPALAAHQSAAAFTRGDHYKGLPGYQVMATHFHMGLVNRVREAASGDGKVPDLEVLKAIGVNIAAPIDGGGGFVAALAKGGDPAYGGDDPAWLKWSRGLGEIKEANPPARAGGPVAAGRGQAGRGGGSVFDSQAAYYETAKRQSGPTFVVMPNMEMIRGDVTRDLGGHTDVFFSHPVFWQQGRLPNQPFVEDDPKFGRIYRVVSTGEMMEMARRENMILFMPHPRTKGSAGFPDAIKDTAHFLDPNYRGVGFRWGMGLDGSEVRLCEYRCLPLFDDMNNWVANKPTPPKYLQAITEVYQQGYGDDTYSNNPVNYVRIPALPPPGDWTPIVNAMKTGDYFVTSGEVLIPSWTLAGTGAARTVVADVAWTFPLDIVEVVWGDGVKTDRVIVSATGLPPHGAHHFEIPINVTGKKWVRFAAWDSAGNGAFVQPVKIVR